MRGTSKLLVGLLAALAVLAACSSPDDDIVIPTLVDLTTLPTARFLTANSPPTQFSVIAPDPLDANLNLHQGWTYRMTGSFEGTFDQSGEPAQGTFEAQVQGNEPGQARRVLLRAEGLAFLTDDALLTLEGVRFSNDYYLVDVNGKCTFDAGGLTGSAAIADLDAGNLIGGVRQATPTGFREDIGNLSAWQYAFMPQDVRLPAIFTGANSAINIEADLWFAPQVNAVLRYDVTVQVQRVHLLWSNRAEASTVSGMLYLHYELDIPELDIAPNISVPHGC